MSKLSICLLLLLSCLLRILQVILLFLRVLQNLKNCRVSKDLVETPIPNRNVCCGMWNWMVDLGVVAKIKWHLDISSSSDAI